MERQRSWLLARWAFVALVALLGCGGAEARAAVGGETTETATVPKVTRPAPLRQVKSDAYAYYAKGMLLGVRSERLREEAERSLSLTQEDRAAKRRQAAQLWVEACEALKEAAELDPEGVEPARSLGLCLLARGEFDQAAPYLERVVGLAPEDYRSRLRLGRIYEGQERVAEALDQYRGVLEVADLDEIQSLLPALYLRLADLTRELHGLAASVGPLAQALDHSPDRAEVLRRAHALVEQACAEDGFGDRAERTVPEERRGFGFHYLLGKVALARREYAAAAEHFRQAVEAKPDFWSPQFRAVLPLIGQGDAAEAVSLLAEVLDEGEADPRLAEAVDLVVSVASREEGFADRVRELVAEEKRGFGFYYLLARAAFVREEWESSAEHCRRALTSRPDSWPVHFFLTLALAKLDRVEEAVTLLTEAQDRGLQPAAALALLGSLELSVGQYEEARAALEKALSLAPLNVVARYELAGVYEKLGLLDKAIELLRINLAIDSSHPDSLNALGYFYAEKNVNLDEAEWLVRRALDEEPDNGAYLDSLGWVFYRQGKLQEALETLSRAAEKLPDPVVYEHLGDVCRDRGELEEARHWWQRALELDPEAASLRQKLEDSSPEGRAAEGPPEVAPEEE